MTDHPTITRIDQNAPRVIAATEAEQHLFEHYGLEFTTHYVELKQPNIRVRVLEVGSGPPVLLVPGGSGEAWNFVPLMAELKGWRLIAVNRPGGGMSDGVDHRQVDLRRFSVATLSSVLDAFGLKRVPAIGNSMGGLWCFWLALDQPERVSMVIQMGCPALILDTSAPFFMRLMSVPVINRLIVRSLQPSSLEKVPEGFRHMGTRQKVIDTMPKVVAETGYYFCHLPTFLDTWLTLVQAVGTLRGAKPKLQLGPDQLSRVRQPVLFIWGDNDPFGGLDVARQAVDLVPKAKLYEMTAGHFPYWDDPALCGRVIRKFLSKPE